MRNWKFYQEKKGKRGFLPGEKKKSERKVDTKIRNQNCPLKLYKLNTNNAAVKILDILSVFSGVKKSPSFNLFFGVPGLKKQLTGMIYAYII